MPGGPNETRRHLRQWRRVEVQGDDRTDTDGETSRGRGRQSIGRKRDRPRREGSARETVGLSGRWHRAPPWAATETERYQEVANTVRAQGEAGESGGSAVNDEQRGKGDGRCKRHCRGNGQPDGPYKRRKEVQKKGGGVRGAAPKKKGGDRCNDSSDGAS